MTRENDGNKPNTNKTALHMYDATLCSVARALGAMLPGGATLASGASTRFPPPGIALRGGDEEELSLPLSTRDKLKIKSSSQCVVPGAWEAGNDSLELRNDEWHLFVEECVASVRDTLGIPSTAVVQTLLSKMMLMEQGAALHVGQLRERGGKPSSAFGCLVVMLPGAFEGGAITAPTLVHDDNDASRLDEAAPWHPGGRKNIYSITYAAFYDRCTYEVAPLTSGTALCLVYDLKTTTPREVPRYFGSEAIQQWVHELLDEYFDVATAQVSKRFKISADAWRTVNEFAAERHFVYLVGSNSVDGLLADERKIAQSLAAFCDQSGGQFVLYFADVLCSREVWPCTRISTTDDEAQRNVNVTVKAPWIKFGESTQDVYPPVFLRTMENVLPLRRVSRFPFELKRSHYSLPSIDKLIVDKLYRSKFSIEVFTTHALVVQPASFEQSQIARLPMKRAIEKICRMITDSRDQTIAYVRRVIYHRPDWVITVCMSDNFADFVRMLVDINDRQLFFDWLVRVELCEVDERGELYDGIKHFGWAECESTLVQRVLSTESSSGRVNFVLSTVEQYSNLGNKHQPLLDALLSLDPWTDVKVALRQRYKNTRDRLCVDDVHRLLRHVHKLSHERMVQVLCVQRPRDIVNLTVPALMKFAGESRYIEHLRPTLEHALSLLEGVMAAICAHSFAQISIQRVHCDKCEEIQAFLSSREIGVIVKYRNMAQHKHIHDVLQNATRGTNVRVETSPVVTIKALRLFKEVTSDRLFTTAKYRVEGIMDKLR